MSKTKEYSPDVHHKIERGCKKISKELKIPILTIRAITKKFQSTKDVKNQPGRGRGG